MYTKYRRNTREIFFSTIWIVDPYGMKNELRTRNPRKRFIMTRGVITKITWIFCIAMSLFIFDNIASTVAVDSFNNVRTPVQLGLPLCRYYTNCVFCGTVILLVFRWNVELELLLMLRVYEWGSKFRLWLLKFSRALCFGCWYDRVTIKQVLMNSCNVTIYVCNKR